MIIFGDLLALSYLIIDQNFQTIYIYRGGFHLGIFNFNVLSNILKEKKSEQTIFI